jgi:hypothetical protein
MTHVFAKKTINIICSENYIKESSVMSNTTVYYNALHVSTLIRTIIRLSHITFKKFVTFLILSTKEVYIDVYMLTSFQKNVYSIA